MSIMNLARFSSRLTSKVPRIAAPALRQQSLFRGVTTTVPARRFASQSNDMRLSSLSRISMVTEEIVEPNEHAMTNADAEENVTQTSTQQNRHEAVSHEANLLFRDVKISEVLNAKEKFGNAVHGVFETDSVLVAVEMMNMYGIGAILVKNQQGQITGYMSTRDYMNKVGCGEHHPKQSLVKDLMRRETPYVYNDESLVSGLHHMLESGARYLLVRERDSTQVVGLISIGDAVRNLLSQYRETSNHMQHMIKDSYSYSEATPSIRETIKNDTGHGATTAF